MAKLLHIFYHKEGTFSLLCQQVQYFTLSYPSIAKKFHTSTMVVESNIRTVVRHLFNEQKDILKPIFGYIPNKCPSNAQFLDALAFAYKESCKNPNFIQLTV